jgi:hypothetical protein
MGIIAAQNASNSARLSLSVGSTMSVPASISGSTILKPSAAGLISEDIGMSHSNQPFPSLLVSTRQTFTNQARR